MKQKEYQSIKTVEYAKKWAYGRNPKYYNFDAVGGDCTSFVSQCIYAGSGVMNYNKYGWYYNNGNDKSPSWSGVKYLFDFLTQNKGIGPYGVETNIENVQIGDIAQLSFNGQTYAHSLLIVHTDFLKNINNTLIAAHTEDAFERSIGSYNFKKIRYIHLQGVRYY